MHMLYAVRSTHASNFPLIEQCFSPCCDFHLSSATPLDSSPQKLGDLEMALELIERATWECCVLAILHQFWLNMVYQRYLRRDL